MDLPGISKLRELTDDVWRHFTPLANFVQKRRVMPPNGFPHPELRIGQLVGYLLMGKDEIEYKHAYQITATRISEFESPLYFLGNDFVKACLATEVPDDFKIGDVKLPMPAFTLCLSWELQMEYFGRPVPFINVCHMPKGKVPVPNPFNFEKGGNGVQYITNTADRIAILASVGFEDLKEATLVDYVSVYQFTEKINDILTMIP